MVNLVRMWVNQPSTHQYYHSLHGANVLAHLDGSDYVKIWHTSGRVITQKITTIALSRGWVPQGEDNAS